MTERIELPSGGWWELRTPVTWGMRKAFTQAALRLGASYVMPDGKPDRAALQKALESGNVDLSAVDDAYLLHGTLAWSFPEPIEAQALNCREERDVNAVLARARELYKGPEQSERDRFFGTPSPPAT